MNLTITPQLLCQPGKTASTNTKHGQYALDTARVKVISTIFAALGYLKHCHLHLQKIYFLITLVTYTHIEREKKRTKSLSTRRQLNIANHGVNQDVQWLPLFGS